MAHEQVSIEGLTPAAAAAVVKLARNLGNSADINERVQFYQLAKKADPSVVVPVEVQLEQYKREQAAAEQTRETERRAAEVSARLNAQKQSLIDSGRYDEATVKRMEDEIMTPKGISDYEVAATLFAASAPDQNITPPEHRVVGRTWTMPWEGKSKEEVGALMANSRKAAVEKANDVLTEIKRSKKRA